LGFGVDTRRIPEEQSRAAKYRNEEKPLPRAPHMLEGGISLRQHCAQLAMCAILEKKRRK